MKFYFSLLFLLFTAIGNGQSNTDDVIIKHLKEQGTTSVDSIRSIMFRYTGAQRNDTINVLWSKIFEFHPEQLELNFHQEVVNLALDFYDNLDKKNKEAAKKYYDSLRRRLGEVLTGHQQLLLKAADFNFYAGRKETAYANLVEVIRIDKSRIPENNELNKLVFTSSPAFFQLAEQAYTKLLRILPVDDFRFKMLVRNNDYFIYRKYDDFKSCEIINKKLIDAGYKPLSKPDFSEKKIDLEKIMAASKKKEEEERKRYEWEKAGN